ncbi:hypothetical protein [Synechococcus sp. CCAP 1479/9]|uniref:hypothetical protein n=1 Tax=Synechococcus sp. CCAP 1479/9 TaxID=1221593 RepID=UPI001C245095|nr:hypothetical protein [Synechococcus sp. CCAP 1479/9]
MPTSLTLPLGSSQPSMVVEPEIDITPDLVSVHFCENLKRCKQFDVSVINWGAVGATGAMGIKYVGVQQGSDRIALGATATLQFGGILLSSGKIIRLAPSFPSGANPTLTITVRGAQPRLDMASASFSLSYGAELREFHPQLALGRNRIQATGIVDGSPLLRAGVRLQISGLGTTFDGSYAVSETMHQFDLSGYRTSFLCEKPIP